MRENPLGGTSRGMTIKIALFIALPVSAFLIGMVILYLELIVWANSVKRESDQLWGPWDIFEMALLLWGFEISFSAAGYATILYLNRTALSTMSLQAAMRVIGFVIAITLVAVPGICLISPAWGAMTAPLVVTFATVLATQGARCRHKHRHKTPNTG